MAFNIMVYIMYIIVDTCNAIQATGVFDDIPMTVSLLIATVLFAMQDSVLQAESSLVLYDESAIPPHYKPFKHFTFGNHSVTIKQNWAEQGVAGVVWDAAVVLCEYIVANPTLFLNKKVLS
ncbi:METTL21A [Bugula neritina]|uniref:METTL21A n=1 Tax=Bugula neritina TaxID=10212 RepID=A0A7J7JFK6_BUGNE|nr:METTL21A [Bugula neritina]